MQTSHAKTIRGLSIAVIILSVLSIIGLLLSLVLLGASGAALGNDDLRNSVSMSIEMDPDTVYTMNDLGITTDDAFGILGLLLGLGSAYIIWGVICSLIPLIAGIIGLRNAGNTAKLGAVLGWSIAGAILAFLYGNIVTMVLLIISAVCASKDRKASTAIPFGQPAAYYGAPQQPYAAPQQPQPYAAPQQAYGAQPQKPAQQQSAASAPAQNDQQQ